MPTHRSADYKLAAREMRRGGVLTFVFRQNSLGSDNAMSSPQRGVGNGEEGCGDALPDGHSLGSDNVMSLSRRIVE